MKAKKIGIFEVLAYGVVGVAVTVGAAVILALSLAIALAVWGLVAAGLIWAANTVFAASIPLTWQAILAGAVGGRLLAFVLRGK